jgi:site-specific DNA recombinase
MKALIYCRVSSQKQVQEGTGNKSQEQRCREYCKSNQYEVEKIFVDDGVSGGLFDRPAMRSLISYVDKHVGNNYVVVFDDLSRFARDLGVHLKLRGEFVSRGCHLKCLNFNFEDTPEGELIENVTASMNHYERQKNRRQVMQKQKARLEQGYWPFCNPIGLRFIRDKEHGKLLIPDEQLAPIFKEAIERYANGFLRTQTEVFDFIRNKYVEQNINRTLSKHGVNYILKQILYTGFVEYLPWQISLREGKHKGFITFETYEKVQARLAGINKAKPRKNYLEDFALRGFICCSECGKPYTASWNTGRSKKYANYTCKTVGCSFRWKSISKEILHADFRKLLQSRTLDSVTAKLIESILFDVLQRKKELEFRTVNQDEHFKAELSIQIKNLVDCISKTNDSALVEIYQDRIKALQAELIKVDVKQSSAERKYSDLEFGTALKKTISVLENPLDIWKTDNTLMKRNLLNFYFDRPLVYSKTSGFGTAEYRREINIFYELGNTNFNMVEMAGIEPAY